MNAGYVQQSLEIEYNNVTAGLTLTVDQVDVTSNVTALNSSQALSFDHFDVSNDNITLLSVVFSTGVVVNISVAAPYILTMSMSGKL